MGVLVCRCSGAATKAGPTSCVSRVTTLATAAPRHLPGTTCRISIGVPSSKGTGQTNGRLFLFGEGCVKAREFSVWENLCVLSFVIVPGCFLRLFREPAPKPPATGTFRRQAFARALD